MIFLGLRLMTFSSITPTHLGIHNVRIFQGVLRFSHLVLFEE